MSLILRSLLLVVMLAACSMLSAGQASSWVEEDEASEWSLSERLSWSSCPAGFDIEPDEQMLADAHSRTGQLPDDHDHPDAVDDVCPTGHTFSAMNDSAGKPIAQTTKPMSRWPQGLFRPPQA